jgi:DNA-binding ferritin-like protein
MDRARILRRDPGYSASSPEKATVQRPSKSVDSEVAACVAELMASRTSFHKLHLKVTGAGSYAAHVALNDLYDALPGHADGLAEAFQGASLSLLDIPDAKVRSLDSVDSAISYIKEMKEMVSGLQEKIPYSEIVNDLDTLKSTFNTALYKLKFLK